MGLHQVTLPPSLQPTTFTGLTVLPQVVLVLTVNSAVPLEWWAIAGAPIVIIGLSIAIRCCERRVLRGTASLTWFWPLSRRRCAGTDYRHPPK